MVKHFLKSCKDTTVACRQPQCGPATVCFTQCLSLSDCVLHKGCAIGIAFNWALLRVWSPRRIGRCLEPPMSPAELIHHVPGRVDCENSISGCVPDLNGAD